jgi:hypothetical protein
VIEMAGWLSPYRPPDLGHDPPLIFQALAERFCITARAGAGLDAGCIVGCEVTPHHRNAPQGNRPACR